MMMMIFAIYLGLIQLTAPRILHNSQEMKHNVLNNPELGAQTFSFATTTTRQSIRASEQEKFENIKVSVSKFTVATTSVVRIQ